MAIAADCKSALIEFGGSSPSTPTNKFNMATLETQYKDYQSKNPDSKLTFEEWKKELGNSIGRQMSEIFAEVNKPEYKLKRIEENKKYLDDVTMDYQLGYFVGEQIVSRYLPTLSTDMLQSRNIIQVNEEDTIENKRLDDEWFKSTHNKKIVNGDLEGDSSKWDLYHQHNKMLEKKYLPEILECYFNLIKITNEEEFKKGLGWSLWDCDMCSYSTKPEDITIDYDLEFGSTIIKLKLRIE